MWIKPSSAMEQERPQDGMLCNIVIDHAVRSTTSNRPTAMRPGALPGVSSNIGLSACGIHPYPTLDTANVPFDGIPAFCSRKTVDSWLKVTKSASYKPVIAEAFLKPDLHNDLFHLDSPSKLLLDVPRPCVLMTLNWVAGLIETQPRCLLASKGAAVSSKRFSKILVQYANLTIRTTL